MKSTVLEGLYIWSVWQPDRRIDFNGFYWSRPDGGLLIDPMEMLDDQLAFCRAQGGARWILVTNADHLRAAPLLREALGAELWAPAEERARLGDAPVDGWFERTSDLPEPLRPDVDVLTIRGGKSPVETALFLRPLRALVFGDVVRSHECGRMRLLPDEKLADRARVLSDLAPLAELSIDAVLLGDGDSFFVDAGDTFRRFVAGLA